MAGLTMCGRACLTILAAIPSPPMKSASRARTSWSAGSNRLANRFSDHVEKFSHAIPIPLCGRRIYFSLKRFITMKFLLLALVPLLAAALARSAAGARAALPETSESEQIKVAQQGLDLLMNGEIEAALKVFQKIESDDPRS